VFNWNIKSFTGKYHMEAVPGSKQFIALLPGNVKANIQIEWPVKSYLNGFQVCTEVSWDIADEDFYMFMNNVTLPGQVKNITAEPTVSYKLAKGKFFHFLAHLDSSSDLTFISRSITQQTARDAPTASP
jgi:hypothetical protein